MRTLFDPTKPATLIVGSGETTETPDPCAPLPCGHPAACAGPDGCGWCAEVATLERDLAMERETWPHGVAEAAIRERDELRAALAALVDSLPKCDQCSKPATRAFRRGEGRWCDEHGRRFIADADGVGRLGRAPEYPRAAALRAAEALLGRTT